MKILAFMQNMWLKNAAQHQRTLDRAKAEDPQKYIKLRRRMVAYALFAGCRSGQVLLARLGKPYCERIVWEEASPIIGIDPNSNHPADHAHILEVIAHEKPDVIIAFGRNASNALGFIWSDIIGNPVLMHYPHPAARHPDDHAKLKDLRVALDTVCAALQSHGPS